MTLFKIRLEMARTPKFPEGNPKCGYEFIAPLDASGRLDESRWRSSRDLCVVHRFSDTEPDERGALIHHRGKWMFSYRPGEDDDEPIFRLDTHLFRSGEYVSVTEHDGLTYPFRVVSVRPTSQVQSP